MRPFFLKFLNHLKEFTPKSVICLKEGYGLKTFFHDLCAGASVGVIALPLALAFAIASGVSPEKGLFTAIIAGFLISLLGGSRVQIGGPTGAYVVLVYGVVQKFGYEGLAAATLMAAVMLLLMGWARLGVLLKFIPYPVTIGFTTGIALVIFSSQIKDFLGLSTGPLPPDFLGKWALYAKHFVTFNGFAVLLSVTSLALVFLFKRFFPRWPGAMIAIAVTTLMVQLFHLPVETIESKFGGIPRVLPGPHFPLFSLELFKAVFPSAVTIALLGAIESLLCALVADGMTGHKHRSNCELVAQGFANIGAVLFGGMPATGAIARTAANIKLGAKTPVAGMIHAITIFILMFFLAPLVSKIPLCGLSGILIFIAWNMAELPHFWEILKGQKGDSLVLLITFSLTVLVDLTVAVQIGVALSAIIFMKRMTDRTDIRVFKELAKDNKDETQGAEETELIFQKAIAKEVAIFEIKGPFFYSVSHLLDDALNQIKPTPKIFILCLDKTPLIDATGLRALKQFALKCEQKEILFMTAGVLPEHTKLLNKAFKSSVHCFSSIDEALDHAKAYIDANTFEAYPKPIVSSV